VAPPTGFYTSAQLADPRKQSREQQLFDEEIGFVLGHELAHHYLNHLPCTSILPLDASEIGQVVTSAVPVFNQPYEAAADVAGVNNVMRTGAQRTGYHFTEGGALLTIHFFAGLDQASPIDIFSFDRTHPPPSVREPVIRTAAQMFRSTNNIRWPWGS
jgi:Zn-dependent protease with chaperone function